MPKITHEDLEKELKILNEELRPHHVAALRGAGNNQLVLVLVEHVEADPDEFLERRVSRSVTKAEMLVTMDAFRRGFQKGYAAHLVSKQESERTPL